MMVKIEPNVIFIIFRHTSFLMRKEIHEKVILKFLLFIPLKWHLFREWPIYTHFLKFSPWFYDFLQIWPMFRDFFGGFVKMRPMFIDFLCEIHPFGWLIPAVLLQPSPGPSCRGGTQIIIISSIYGMHRYENFARKLWKNNVGKWHLFERVILAGTLEWRGTLRVPPQPRCPRVCPPWAHRSYATETDSVCHVWCNF